NQVTNTGGYAVPATTIGSFQVSLPRILRVLNDNDSGFGSLRTAVSEAMSLGGLPEIIVFDSAFFATPRTITLTSGQLSITSPVTIAGPGANLLSISGNTAGRIL